MAKKGVKKRGRKKGVGKPNRKTPAGSERLKGSTYVSVSSLREADDLKIRAVDQKSTEFQDLVTSIKTHGFYDPILVTKRGDSLFVVDGYQRLAAARKVGLTFVPVINAEGSRESLILAAFDLNTRRIQMTPMVEARAVARAMTALGTKKAKVVAKRMGRTERWVSVHTQLLDLPKPLQKALDGGDSQVTIGKCYELLRIHPEDRVRFVGKLRELTEPFFRNHIEHAVKQGLARWVGGRKEPRKKTVAKKTPKEQADKHSRTPAKAEDTPVVEVSGRAEPVVETRSVADIQRACRKVEVSLAVLQEKREKVQGDAKVKAKEKKTAGKLKGTLQEFVDAKVGAWEDKHSRTIAFLRGQIAGLLYAIGLDPRESSLESALKKWRKASGLDKPRGKKKAERKKGVKKAAKKKARGKKKGLKKKVARRKKKR